MSQNEVYARIRYSKLQKKENEKRKKLFSSEFTRELLAEYRLNMKQITAPYLEKNDADVLMSYKNLTIVNYGRDSYSENIFPY